MTHAKDILLSAESRNVVLLVPLHTIQDVSNILINNEYVPLHCVAHKENG